MIGSMKWDITYACNLHCKHCYVTPEQRKTKELEISVVFQAMNKFFDNGIKKIYFLGGEPFFRKDFFDILEYTHKLGILSGIVTNGTLLTEDRLERLLHLDVFKIHVSIDGAVSSTHDWNRGKGTFERAMRTVKLLDDLKRQYNNDMEVGLNFTITKRNFNEIEDFMELADTLNVQIVVPLTYGSLDSSDPKTKILDLSPRDSINTLERASRRIAAINQRRSSQGLDKITMGAHMYPRKVVTYLNNKYNVDIPVLNYTCGAGVSSIHVAPDGTVNPCDGAYFLYDFLESAIGKHKRLKIQENEFDDIINSSFFNESILFFHNPYLHDSIVPCNSCDHNKVCRICPIQTLGFKEVDICIEIDRRLKEES